MLALVKSAACIFLLAFGMPSMAGELRQPLELAWFNDIESQATALSHIPSECVKPLDDPRFNLGRLAFNSPRLLGGQAGRMGLSCASCHPSGRANHKFFIKQISDEPGRADISHHFLSSQGGDNRFNPKPIPDLADTKKLRFKNRSGAAFDQLLVRLIEVEFDGQPAVTSVFESLKLYLSRNDLRYCDTPARIKPRTLQTDWELLEDGLIALAYAIDSNDVDTMKFVSASMRSSLETIYRFYAITPSKSLDGGLLAASRALERLTNEKSIEASPQRLKEVSALLSDLKADLVRRETVSFYNTDLALDYLNRTD